ncbi:uncharacterized protein TM35_000017000 [Trypanosoma theileri]|uniref:AB hydrolase-1 domain-containing protein n=1 Tax=Trypanosoma theileri TaxID=67003 RepID=A0A1X0PB14_9TRYP|nr:uncharacterized protein TM35_000017000 [Trypanosoma theileri]ORC93823.1 hypothetical protein TM35_000017000 [Trypanosoma theileri]
MNFVRRVFTSSPALSALPISETPASLNYALSSFRWHLDSRSPSKAILVHDFLSSSASWQQLLHESLGRLPLSQLTPKVPLELYAVDLRGHNFSKTLPCPADETKFTLACAADIALHQKQILRTDAKLVGMGFGALVACQAALHSPHSGFDSLTLYVNSPSQLMTCDPSHYSLPSIIGSVPKEIKTLNELNQFLLKRVPNTVERALIFSNVDQLDGTIDFRFSNEVLNYRSPLKWTMDIDESVMFTKQVTVFYCSDEPFPEEVNNKFMKHFPKAKFVKLEGTQGGDLSGLYAQGPYVVRTLLESMDLLGEVEMEE